MAPKFINLQQIVLDWAWIRYDSTATSRKQKKLRKKEKSCPTEYIGVKIDWSEVRFTDETKWAQLQDVLHGESDSGSPERGQHVQEGHQPVNEAGPRSSVLFQTKFTNNTTDIQEYTMRTEKTTRSSMTTMVENGFTRGFEMSVKLASPCQVFEANAGYKREFSLTNTDGETFEEELHWGVESVIHVNPQHTAEASLVIDEKRHNGNFVVESKVRGTVYVTFTALRDNNSLIKSTGDDIASIVQEYLDKEKRKAGGLSTIDWVEVTSDNSVIIRTKGSCKFRYGVKQEIVVNQTPLVSTT